MFSVLIEVVPSEGHWDAYLANAKMLRPELEEAPGFLDNGRYRSLTRDGLILSLSSWRDAASISDWHARMRDEEGGEKGWNGLIDEYRLRVGEVLSDTRAPRDHEDVACQTGETSDGEETYVTLIDAKQTPEWVRANNPYEIALYLGFDLNSFGDCISWDIFDGLDSPGEIVLAVTWRDAQSAKDHAATEIVPDDARVRVVRVALECSESTSEEGAPNGASAPRSQAIRA
jgi:heme-degrading monooxygenase HmoA